MPIYEFMCEPCGKDYEVLQGFHDNHEYNCPDCGDKARRMWSSFSFSFDFRDGWDPGLGEYVDTKQQRENKLREKGLTRIKD